MHAGAASRCVLWRSPPSSTTAEKPRMQPLGCITFRNLESATSFGTLYVRRDVVAYQSLSDSSGRLRPGSPTILARDSCCRRSGIYCRCSSKLATPWPGRSNDLATALGRMIGTSGRRPFLGGVENTEHLYRGVVEPVNDEVGQSGDD